MNLTSEFCVYRMFLLLYLMFMVDALPSHYITKTSISCARGRGIYYNVYSDINKTFLIYQSCVNQRRLEIYFTFHYVDGRLLESSNCPRPAFSNAGIRPPNPKHLYDTTRVARRFADELGTNKYFNETSFLARGHLVPDADMARKYACRTYYYINVVPQWQVINRGNWLKLENMIRSYAYNSRVAVYTGTLDTLELLDNNYNPIKIYLGDGDYIPAPKYMWKVIRNTVTNENIAFIVLNNPFINNLNQINMPCEDICQKVNWYNETWSDIGNGYLICCNVTKLAEKINYLYDLL